MTQCARAAQVQTVEPGARREGERSDLLRKFLDAIQIAARCVEIMLVRQRRAEAVIRDVLAQPGDALLQSAHHAPGQVLLHRVVVRGTRAVFRIRPLLERLIAHERERLAGVLSRVHLRRVFQRCHRQEHPGGCIGLHGRVGQTVRVNFVHIGMVVIPHVARVESLRAKVHVSGEEQAQARC